jgi:hypothetical protein
MLADISIIVISSPSPSHPSLYLVESFLSSLEFIPELNDPRIPIHFVFDGYHVCFENRTKKGRVTETLAANYEEYKLALDQYMKSSPRAANYRLHSLGSHHGFAHAVRIGLSLCETTYCLIAQHDRIFSYAYHGIEAILRKMEEHSHIRYVGFPSSTNSNHNMIVQSRYRLKALNMTDMIISVDEQAYLQPLIFWFDSQHLCNVQRYLQIYQPFLSIPVELRQLFGVDLLKEMILRRGDFIEDRFGQCQLKSLSRLRGGCDDDTIKKAFLWYGSYLLWIPGTPYEEYIYDQESIHSYPILASRAMTMVRHKNGRGLDLEREARFESYRQNKSLEPATVTVTNISTTSSDDGLDDIDLSGIIFSESDDHG